MSKRTLVSIFLGLLVYPATCFVRWEFPLDMEALGNDVRFFLLLGSLFIFLASWTCPVWEE